MADVARLVARGLVGDRAGADDRAGPKRRVLAACAISRAKSKVMSTPASGRPNGWPLMNESSGRCSLWSRQASPSSSGVTATGEKAQAGLPCRKPKPLASSSGIRARAVTSLTSMTSLMCRPASAAGVPIGTSSVITATSASRSTPQSSLAAKIGSRGPTKLSEAPWYISGSVQNRSGSSAPRAFRTSSTWVT